MKENTDTKEEFLEASFCYLVKNGLDNVSLRELCKSTGISLGSIYYWFGGKDGLFTAAAEYGLNKVTNSIFHYAFQSMGDLDYFFDSCLEEIAKHSSDLRFIYQVATSPIYGTRMRKRAEILNTVYDSYAEQLSERIHCPIEQIRPMVYIFIAIVLEYVVWGDRETVSMQLDYIRSVLKAATQSTGGKS